MRRLIIALVATMISACSSIEKDYSSILDWDNFGYRAGLSGEVKKSPEDLNSSDENKYNDYLNGYNRGQQAYCEQDAYLLGLTSQVYNGVCDEIDRSFALDYQLGLSQIRTYGSNTRDNIIRRERTSTH